MVESSWTPVLLALMTGLASILWFRRTVVEFGLESVRGQFTALIGGMLLFQAVGFLFVESTFPVRLGLIAALFFILSRTGILLANLRYVWYFLKQGYTLGWLMSLIVVALTLSLLLGILSTVVASSYTVEAIYLVGIDILTLSVVVYNLMLLWGSEITKRWLFGSMVILLVTLGDALFLFYPGSPLPLILWSLAVLFMGITGTLRT